MKKFSKKDKKRYRAIYESMIEEGKSIRYAYISAMKYMNIKKNKNKKYK